MKSIHQDLKDAQESLSSTPYIYISINGTDYGTANTSNPLIHITHTEEPYRESAIIVLDNSNRALDLPATPFTGADLRGESFSIGYGYNTSSGDKKSDTPTLWVKTQHVTSMEGSVVCVLTCEGMWGLLRELQYLPVGEEPYYEVPFGGTQTIKEIIVLALAEADMTLNATVPDDGIIETLKPLFSNSVFSFPSLAALIYSNPDMLRATKCYLRPEASKVFKLIYPQDADAVDETYYSDESPYFTEYTEKRNLLIPNTILVYWGRNDDGSWDASVIADYASAVDQDSIDAYVTGGFNGIVKRVYLAPRLALKADAALRASAILQRFKSEELAGRLVLPYHDCRVELYDRVQVRDKRGK